LLIGKFRESSYTCVFFSLFRRNIVLGGEVQRGSVIHVTGCSEKAQCTGNSRSYLEPISSCMQKPIEGRSRIGCRVNQKQCRRFMKREGVSNREQQNTASSYANSNQNRSATQKYLHSSNGLVKEPCSSRNSPRENSSPLTQANALAAESANTPAHSKKAKPYGTPYGQESASSA